MASVFGIDLIKSTTGLFRNARTRKKGSPWDGEQTGYGRAARHRASDDVGRLVEDEIIPRLLMVHQDDPRMSQFPADMPATMSSGTLPATGADDDANEFRNTSGMQSNDNVRDAAAQSTAGPNTAMAPKPAMALKTDAPRFDDATVRAFASDVLIHEVDVLSDMVSAYLDQNIAPETLFIQLIAPAARELGEKWTRDECDFVDVTMGLWRLQSLLRTVALWAPPSPGWNLRTNKALFTAMPDDQHSLGTLIISECFQRAGWDVETLIEPQQSDILQALSTTSFDLVGLTVTTDFSIGAVPKLLTAMRSVSCNSNLAIMIGGPALGYDPVRARELGADGTAPDAEAALKMADELVSAGVERTALTF
ncbi:B12-binding domain-containing protein [Blastomonas sp.]|uniref:cobalamin B12-binding domain-containing protein n=1 Tax=Blastomonas sp. TaxID=1909299 RepID=UPI0026319222|nr:cobalamin B12-binding domain-containing protein [Blastomonas sp.]MDM7957664.1 cobalamin B12-binding domain-containing protein [Blastomonas sp.]